MTEDNTDYDAIVVGAGNSLISTKPHDPAAPGSPPDENTPPPPVPKP